MNKFEKMAEQYNIVRVNFQGISFSLEEFSNKVKFLEIPKNYSKLWVQFGISEKKERGKYSFPKEPVHYLKIKNAWEEKHRLQRKYQKKYLESKVIPNTKEDVIKEFLKSNNITQEDLAIFLKDTDNYKIIKKVISWESI